MFRKKYIELIGDSLICCWVVHDHNGELVYLNDNAETFFSISREELFAVRKEIEKWQLFDHHGQELEIDSFPVSIALKHGSYSKRLIGFKPQSQNEMKWCSVQAEKVMDPETSSSFVIVSFVDETELVRAVCKGAFAGPMAWNPWWAESPKPGLINRCYGYDP